MSNISDRIRERVGEHVASSYNISQVNETLLADVMRHVTYLNKLIKEFSEMDEARLVQGIRVRVKFESDHDNTAFAETADRVSAKLKECSVLSNIWFNEIAAENKKTATLDLFHHPELEENDTCVPKKNLHLDSADESVIQPASPGSKAPAKQVKKVFKDPSRATSTLGFNTISKELFEKLKKKREEDDEHILITQIFDFLQKKAFISDRYGAILSDYDKLELVLRVCERYQ